MKKVELLSPAGDMQSLYAAVNNGCDAVYISGVMYGARKYASNFSMKELEEAIKYCHLYGVLVYLTVNTIIYDSEVEEFLEYISLVHSYGVDALIIQDLGMIDLIRKKFPNIVIHASTQAHNHNKEGVRFLKDLGVERVVLARELSLKEIEDIDVDIEKEVFIHGALCVSYSGCCLFSSSLLNRSGNRGMCAGLCRLPYELYCNDSKIETSGDYLLSCKEFASFDNISKLLDLGIESLKIEGRMKSSAYVGIVTKIYRNLIDSYYKREDLKVNPDDLKKLKSIYNRSFTKGFLFGENNKDITNEVAPNHQGIVVGEVIEVHSKIKIRLSDSLRQGDGIRFSNNEGMIVNYLYNEKGLLINSAHANDVIFVDNKVNLKELGSVSKTYDSLLVKEIENQESKKILININVEAFLDKKLKVTFSDGKNEVISYGNVINKALKSPIKCSDVREKLGKLGNSPFEMDNFSCVMDDDIFIPVSELNEIRRDLCSKLVDERTKVSDTLVNDVLSNSFDCKSTSYITFVVRNEKQLLYLLDKNVRVAVEDYDLYLKYKDKGVIFRLPRVIRNHENLRDENLIISEIGSLNKYKGVNNITSDVYMNVVNSFTVELLHRFGVYLVGLSKELSFEDCKKLVSEYKRRVGNLNVEVLIYGRIELMVMKYCMLNKWFSNGKGCSVCKGNDSYYLKDRNGKRYKFINRNCITTLISDDVSDEIDLINDYRGIGVSNFRVDLFDEDVKDIEKILKKLGI